MLMQRKLLQWCGGSLWSPHNETIVTAGNFGSSRWKRYTDVFYYTETQQFCGFKRLATKAAAQSLENRKLRRELESLRALAHWQQSEVGTSVDVSTCIFFASFSPCPWRLELPLHARAPHLLIPGRLPQLEASWWNHEAVARVDLEVQKFSFPDTVGARSQRHIRCTKGPWKGFTLRTLVCHESRLKFLFSCHGINGKQLFLVLAKSNIEMALVGWK